MRTREGVITKGRWLAHSAALFSRQVGVSVVCVHGTFLVELHRSIQHTG